MSLSRVGPKRLDGPMQGGSNQEDKILKIQGFGFDPKRGTHPTGMTFNISCEWTVFMNLDYMHYFTRPFYFPQGTLLSHKAESFTHLAGGPIDFLIKNSEPSISFRSHAIVVEFTLSLSLTPGYAVCISG
jgi:hypothetical protein